MRILYINHYAGSPKYGMAFRPFYLAKEWQNEGHVVSIVGADNSHLRKSQPSVPNDLWEEIFDDVKYIWLKTPKYSSTGFQRILNILSFVLKLMFYANRISKRIKPDVVIASSTYPLDIYPAYLIAKKSKAKLVFELHDMWPLSPIIIGGYSKYHPFIWIMQRAENFACKKSNGYVSMLGNAEEYLIEHGLKPGKFVHVTNGFLEEEWNNCSSTIPETHRTLIESIRSKKKVIIGYAGGHAPSNTLDVLIEAASELINTNIEIVLVGNGPVKNDLINLVKNKNLNNVHFLPPVNKVEIPELLENFDILFIGGVKSKLHHYGTAANKLTDYMLAKKPIIFAVDEPKSLVEKVKCGIQIPAEDKLRLIEAIQILSKTTEDKLRDMGTKGREYALKELNYKVLAKKFLSAIESF